MTRRRIVETDELTDLQALLLEFDRIPGCADTKRRIRNLLATLAGKRVYFPRELLQRPAEVELVLALLEGGRTRAQTRDAFMARTQASRAKAYRLISVALDQRRKP